MNKAEDQTGNFLDQYINRVVEMLGERGKTLSDNPSLAAYWMMGIAVLFILILPVLIVGIGWARDLFTVDKLNIINMLFEAMIIGLVFAFGIGLLFYLKTKAPSLVYVIIMICFILAILATSMLGVVTNSCLTDMKCDSLKFSAAIGIVAVLSIASYVLLRVLKRVTPLFGVTYLAVSIWESLIWLWQAGRSTGINPTSDALRGVILLIFSISWLVIFSASSQKTDVKAVQPNRWGT